MSTTDWEAQIFYQVFVRSFRDGDGDGIGDFKGLAASLDYLKELGVTALWLNPVFPSPTSHNYFATDFFSTDPDYGSLLEFRALCRAVHERDMRILIDMETQYVPREHPWFDDALDNPDSSYGPFFIFRGKGNTAPVFLSMRMGEEEGKIVDLNLPEIVTLNLLDPMVERMQRRLYSYWLDPSGEDPDSGVDGYRLDHVMDDLDHKGVLKGLYAQFWRPLIYHLRKRHPDAFFVAEPADWKDYGGRLYGEASMDGVFAMPLMFAIRGFDRDAIVDAVDRHQEAAPPGRFPFLVLENHDVTRFATAVDETPALERLGAALMFTLPGVPTLYYGQEIGMTGEAGSDDRDFHLPVREAFRWHRDPAGSGMAVWYRNEWLWEQSALKRDDGRTLEDQRADDGSLYRWYRRLIDVRRTSPALSRGRLQWLDVDCEQVLAFVRRHPEQKAVVLINLSAESVECTLDLHAGGLPVVGEAVPIVGTVTSVRDPIPLDGHSLVVSEVWT